MRRTCFFCLLLLIGTARIGLGQEGADPAPTQADEPKELHWAVRLGMRSLQVELSIPVLDRVVLVPDEATYLDELAKWSPQGRWPVLIEDDVLAPMFVRRFKPQQIILRESVGELPDSNEARQASLERIQVKVWGGNPEQDSIRDTLTRQGYLPPGVIIASVKDPAWTAAIALAAGRGLPLLWMDESFGKPDSALDPKQSMRLKQRIDEQVASLQYPYENIGDVIDTITVCRAIAGRLNVELPQAKKINVPEKYRDGPVAMTDVLGRREDWDRYAFTGWIYGDSIRCAYVAMCSLFLPRVNVDLINTYPSDSSWAAYGLGKVELRLEELGFEAESKTESAASLSTWRRWLGQGSSADLLLMNSRGNVVDFHLTEGRASALDVPLHHVPVAILLIHSWSMQYPSRRGTVAGRWLDNGAYAYVGSMHEPLLNAFVPPNSLVARFNGLVPILVAARIWPTDGVFSRPWRINTFGDPLMLCPSKAQRNSERVQQPATYGMPIEDHIRAMMELIKAKPAQEVFAETIRSLHLWGRDDLIVQVWELARQQDMESRASVYMLEVFFRLGQDEAFLEAWEASENHTDRQCDMLWHRFGSRLGSGVDRATLLLLESGMRHTLSQVDAARLAPHFDRVLGRARTRVMLQDTLARAPSPSSEQRIKKLLGEYPEQ